MKKKTLLNILKVITDKLKRCHLTFIFAPCILESIQFIHQQMHCLLNLEKFKIYIQIHTNIAPTCFGLRPSSGGLYWTWLMLYLC